MADYSKMEPGEALSLTGSSVGRFLIRERIGVGGMGEVYRAEDTKLNRSVAIKRMSGAMRSDPLYRRRFLKEAERASQLTDSHIAALYDIIEDGGEIFLVMELVEGVSFRQRFTHEIPLKQFLEVALQCARGLRAAHAHHIIHCDIKPENIMISSSDQVKILDFGLARKIAKVDASSAAFTSANIGMSGTPGYIAPEIMLEETPDPRSDIFSLGVLFYEALSGSHPFRKRTVFETADSVMRYSPPPLTTFGVPAGLSDIVARMMSKEPARRYVTADQLIAALEAFANTSQANLTILNPGLGARQKRPSRLWNYVRAHRTAALLTGLLIVAVALGVLAGRRVRSMRHVLGLSKAPQVAVLPFQEIGGQPSDQAFAAGLSDVITSELSQLSDRYILQVIPSTEVRSEGVTNARAAMQHFGADLVVEGSLQPVANMLRASYSVVDAHTGRQLKAGTISVSADNPFVLQDQLATSIVEALGLDLAPADRQFAAKGTTDSAAYQEYLRGVGYLQDYHKKENLDAAIAAFNTALKHDSAYALAYAGLGETYWHRSQELLDNSNISDALLACQRALSITPDLVEGHRCLGRTLATEGKYDKAAQELELAVNKRPTDDQSVRALALAYQSLRQFDRAEATYRRAIDLRPHYWGGYNWMGTFYFERGQYDKALQMFQQVVVVAPDNYRGYTNSGAIYIMQGAFGKAIKQFERSVQLRPSFAAYSNLGTAYFFERRYSDAVVANYHAVQLNDRDFVSWGNLGDAQYFAGQRDTARASYLKALDLTKQQLAVNRNDARALGSAAMYYAMIGQYKQAEDYLRAALAQKPDGPDIWWQASVVYAELHRKDETISAIQSALAAGLSSPYINSSPYFDDIRQDPRFIQLIQSAEKLEHR